MATGRIGMNPAGLRILDLTFDALHDVFFAGLSSLSMNRPNNPVKARIPLLVCTALLFWMGCQTEAATDPAPVAEADVSIPFHKDGSLDFVRGGEAFTTIDIEIAESDSTIERGLMQRTSMPEMSGMLFLMPEEELQAFWMSNTKISLDILFANGEGEIVRIAKYTVPLSPNSVPSEYPARYVVEVPAGFSDTQGVIEGDRIEWRRLNE